MIHVEGALVVMNDPIRMGVLVVGYVTHTGQHVDVYDSVPKRTARYVHVPLPHAVLYLNSMLGRT